ncbi:MAG TPA: I78 family peptidase inhibitor [Hyphomonadaceae bacterium]|jgi:hypothetical protein|nr:I78 family peptidase inhibitor [Hyphomonadaceae bacterium]HPN05776.1 I78 family peptidase inhibitor [Hyphomonadaceae bacterium]
MKHVLALIALAAMAACTTTPEGTSPMGASETVVMPPEQADACRASAYQTLVGKPATDPAVPPADKLVRHIHPDSIVTMDYVFKRLNIEIDTKDIITGIRCG